MSTTLLLYYICSIKNLSSILKHGIIARNDLGKHGIINNEIATPGIIDRRAKKMIPNCGKPLLDHVNLFLQPRNSMLFSKRYQNVVVLEISCDILTPDAYCTDGIAASFDTSFFPLSQFAQIKPLVDVIMTKEFWYTDKERNQMSAEVLIPAKVSPNCITSIHVGTDDMKKIVENEIGAQKIPISVNPYMFFIKT